MESLKKQIKNSYKMEMIGTGIYRSLASQYRENENLKKRFIEFADQEEKHGRMFREYYKKTFGKKLKSGSLWLFTGRTAAFAMHFIPLEKKLKKIGAAETAAVKRIEEALASGEESGFHKIIKRILPDEKAHASLYGELFSK